MKYPGVELLGYKVSIYLLKRKKKPISNVLKMAVEFYIPTSNTQELQLLHI
jgi:hypothetical protein